MADTKKSKKIFMNQVDSYHGSSIAKYLSNCIVGASLEEEEEDDEEEEIDDAATKPKEGCYEIHGTTKDIEAKKPDFVKVLANYSTKEELLEHVIDCDIVIYDITQNPDQIEEALWILDGIHSNFDRVNHQIVFILLSTVMTWAKSKPLDPDDPEIPFTEEDYRRRKAHPNFRQHIDAEKTTIKCGKTKKSKLITFVIASGLTYGAGENLFHYLYKDAWHNSAQLTIFGAGQNILPTIHVRDLAAVIQNVADSRPKNRYLIAVDDSQNTLDDIVRAVATHLSNGRVKNITKEEALLRKDIEQAQFDHLLSSLRMDAIFVKENMNIRWVCETGITENIEMLVKEYKQSRGLLPIRVCVLGPPACGKTTIVKQLCAHYKLHHIKIKDVIDEAMANLEKSAARADAQEGVEEEEDDEGRAAEDAETLEAIKEGMSDSGRIELVHITKFIKDKLMSKPCQNQGFILDGYPKTREQAEDLFSPEDEEEEEEEGKSPSYNRAIMPDNLVMLEADDQFLKQRIMQLPEAVVSGTHNTEEGLLRRLVEFRSVSNEEDTVLNYFDEREIHPVHFDVTLDKSAEHKDIVEKIKNVVGSPRNYGLTPEELEEIRAREEEERLRLEAEQRALQERQEAEEAAQRSERQAEWSNKLETQKAEEQQVLELKSHPLRKYLMKHVMPVLTEGMIECVKARPEDAVDYLAEYLFRNNPQVD